MSQYSLILAYFKSKFSLHVHGDLNSDLIQWNPKLIYDEYQILMSFFKYSNVLFLGLITTSEMNYQTKKREIFKYFKGYFLLKKETILFRFSSSIFFQNKRPSKISLFQ